MAEVTAMVSGQGSNLGVHRISWMLARGLIPSTGGHAWVIELPKLGLLGRSKLAVLCFGVALLLNVSALVNLSLRGKALLVGFLVTAFSSTVPPARAGGHSRYMQSQGQTLLGPFEGHVHGHDGVKVLKLPIRLANNNGRADRLKGWVFDTFLEMEDLHPLVKGLNTIFQQGSMMVMLLNMSHAVLVERIVCAVP